MIRYALKQDKILNKEGRYVVVTRNLRSRSTKGFTEEFHLNHLMRQYTRSNGVECYHTVLSWNHRDAEQISEKVLRDMAHKYMGLRSKGSLYLAVAHFNTDEPHVHIIHSGSTLAGKSARISKAEFAQLKLDLDEYQQKRFPFLVNSLPQHGKAQRQKTVPEKSAYKNARTPLDKEKIQGWLDKAYEKAHCIDEFVSSVEESGLEIYKRDGRLQGILYKGLKHRFSKYGIDKEKFQSLLDMEQKEAKMLEEIEAIRSSKDKDREIDLEDDLELSRDEPDTDSDDSEVNEPDEEYGVDEEDEEDIEDEDDNETESDNDNDSGE